MTDAPAHADLAPLLAQLPDGYPDGLREMVEWLYLSLVESLGDMAELTPERLAEVALSQGDQISAIFGGTAPYIPKGVSFRLSPRNLEMCRAFRGDYRAMARQYGLSEQQCRNIIDRWQRQQFLHRQGDMFGQGQREGG